MGFSWKTETFPQEVFFREARCRIRDRSNTAWRKEQKFPADNISCTCGTATLSNHMSSEVVRDRLRWKESGTGYVHIVHESDSPSHCVTAPSRGSLGRDGRKTLLYPLIKVLARLLSRSRVPLVLIPNASTYSITTSRPASEES